MKKKVLGLVLATAMVATVFTGCGSSSKGKESTGGKENTSVSIEQHADVNKEEQNQDNNQNNSSIVSKYPKFEDEFSLELHTSDGATLKTGMTKENFLAIADEKGWDIGDANDKSVRKLTSTSDINARNAANELVTVTFMEEPDATVTVAGFRIDNGYMPDATFNGGMGYDVDLDEMAKCYKVISEDMSDDIRPKRTFELAPYLKVEVCIIDGRDTAYQFDRIPYEDR